MNCAICSKPIINKNDIHWLDDIIVCTDCYEKEQSEAKLEWNIILKRDWNTGDLDIFTGTLSGFCE